MRLNLTPQQIRIIIGCLLNVRDQDESGASPEQLAEAEEIDVILTKIADQTGETQAP